MTDNTKYRILVVDDDSDIREMIALLLSKEGFGYDTTANGDEALTLCVQKPFDVVLLDIMMPGTDGYAFCEALRRKNRRCFILFITALDGPDVLEKALLLGGDDFIRKPFEPRELLARIASCLRRLDGTAFPQSPAALMPLVLPGGAQLVPDKNIIVTSGQPIHFTPIETGLLCLLVSHPGRKFTYAELYEQVWETEYLDDKGTIATFISAIKKKLKDGNIRLNIETVWGEGYYYKAGTA